MDVRRFLAKPVLKLGCYSSIGGKESQEDRVVAIPDINYSGICYCAVFDGHGGAYVADYLARNFHLQMSLHSLFKYQTKVALEESWKLMDEKLYEACIRYEQDRQLTQFPHDGSTATVCLITGDNIWLTNIGDSAAYVIDTDGLPHKLTEDHGTSNAQEVERCKQAGGELIEQRTPHRKHGHASKGAGSLSAGMACCLPWLQHHSEEHGSNRASGHSHNLIIKPRLYPGGLLITRSFGDFYAKKEHLGGKKNVVIADHGQVAHVELRKDKVKYLIVASDGIWDIFDIHQIQAMITNHEQVANSSTNKQAAAAAPISSLRSHATVSPDPATAQILSPVPSSTAAVVPMSNITSNKLDQTNAIREEIHEMTLNGHINTKESTLDAQLSLLCKKICLSAVHAPEWTQEGARADNASCIIVEITFPSN